MEETAAAGNRRKQNITVLVINGCIALAHVFPLERILPEGIQRLYPSYFSDLVLPFGFYYLLFFSERQLRFLKPWWVKFLAVFLTPCAAEICQYFGIPVLGATFDPIDFLMYASGAMAAVLLDRIIFYRIFDFWNADQPIRTA